MSSSVTKLTTEVCPVLAPGPHAELGHRNPDHQQEDRRLHVSLAGDGESPVRLGHEDVKPQCR